MKRPIQIALSAAGVAAGLALGFAHPFAELSIQANAALGILLGAIVWWVVGLVPEFVTALIMAVLFIVVAQVPADVTFSAFSNSTWWLLVAAFCLGLGLQKSGLMRRMALGILRIFPRTFRAQSAGLLAAGTLIGPFIPSMAAKAAMLAPLSMGISDSLGYERKSPQANGLFLAMFLGIRNVGPAVISASFLGYGILALLPEEVAAQFDLLHWLVAALPWFIVITVVTYLLINVFYAPKGASAKKTTDAAPAIETLGPWSSQEKIMLVIMICTVGLWVSEPLHHLPAYIVALSAAAISAVCGIFSSKDFRSGIAWDSLIFIGAAMGLAEVFGYLGIDVWIVNACQGLFETLAQNPYAFVLGIGIITAALRFIVVSEMAYLNIFLAFMVPLSVGFGINPWIVGFCTYALVNPWFVPYQNSIYLTAYYATDGEMVNHAPLALFCIPYIALCLIGLVISVPYWQWMGLF